MKFRRLFFLLLASGLVSLYWADLEFSAVDATTELARLLAGIVHPQFDQIENLFSDLLRTIAFAFCGVALGVLLGGLVAFFYSLSMIRFLMTGLRSVHELFWALLCIQFLGINNVVGVIAIAIPYAGIFARIFHELVIQTPQVVSRSLAGNTSSFWLVVYGRIPLAWLEIRNYIIYRMECGLRSSTVLGFVGLPTLGFQLHTFFSQGDYGAAGAILLIFYLLIFFLPRFAGFRMLFVGSLAGVVALYQPLNVHWASIRRFFFVDIVPYPLRQVDGALGPWLMQMWRQEIHPGLIGTLVLAQLALVIAAFLTLILFPLMAPRMVGKIPHFMGRIVLIFLRSTPEYILAYIFLQTFGPSMIPGILAIALHHSAVIAHLVGQKAQGLRPLFIPAGFTGRYFYQTLPRILDHYFGFLLYRWEMMIRESSVIGMLGITTLGFYIDSAIQNLYLDQALLLILCTMLINIGAESLARVPLQNQIR